jgi:hypothetical protein
MNEMKGPPSWAAGCDMQKTSEMAEHGKGYGMRWVCSRRHRRHKEPSTVSNCQYLSTR